MITTLRRFFRADAGGAMVELAIAMPILTLLAMAVADFGGAYYRGIRVASAVRAAAQYGATSGVSSATQDDAMIQVARDDSGNQTLHVTPSHFCKCPDGSTPDCASGTCPGYSDGTPEIFVEVKAVDTVSFLFHYPGAPARLVYRDSAVMRAQ